MILKPLENTKIKEWFHIQFTLFAIIKINEKYEIFTDKNIFY